MAYKSFIFVAILWLVRHSIARPADESQCDRFFSPGRGLDLCRSTFTSVMADAAKQEAAKAAQKAACVGGINTAYNQDCYQALDIGQYVQDWSKSTPRCNDTNSAGCCTAKEPWSTCFLRLNLDADFDCTQINVGSCSLEGHHSNQSGDPDTAAKKRYVVRNIYGTLRFQQSRANLTNSQRSTTSSCIGVSWLPYG